MLSLATRLERFTIGLERNSAQLKNLRKIWAGPANCREQTEVFSQFLKLSDNLFLSEEIFRYFDTGENEFDQFVEKNESVRDMGCKVVCFRNRAAKGNVSKYWVAVDHFGQAARSESYSKSKLFISTDIFFYKIKYKNKEYLIPTKYIINSFIDATKEELAISGEPVSVTELYLLKDSIKINHNFGDSDFEVKFPSGINVVDLMKNKTYSNSQAATKPPRNVLESEDQLKKLLAEASGQQQELQAASKVRSGPEWWIWLPWSVAGLVALALGVLAIKRFRG